MDSPPDDSDEDTGPGPRKIIHVDMDAFYASVEQRDEPALRGRPVAVGGSRARGVVAAASYEARRFGVHSAMASARAAVLCPDLIFRKARFDVYREVSRQIRAIFAAFSDQIEPLSLDEAYLDVTRDAAGLGSATSAAQAIRARIRAETGLTASAGVSYNKFLAKLASDQNKPDGLCVIRLGEGAAFVGPLPVRRFHGIGPRGAEKMAALGIRTGADLAAQPLDVLRARFGAMGDYLYRAARGIDWRPVRANARRKSLGGERTFDRDLASGSALRAALDDIIELVWDRIAAAGVQGRTVTCKLKLADFTLLTRALSLDRPVAGRDDFARAAHGLLDGVLPLPQPVRLVGLTLSGLIVPAARDEAPAAPALRARGQLELF